MLNMKDLRKKWNNGKEVVYINPDKQTYVFVNEDGTTTELVPMYVDRDTGHMELWTEKELDDFNLWGESHE